MRVLLLQLDGKIPNLALMRLADHHRARGDEVTLRVAGNVQALQRRLDDAAPDRVYASAIFTRSRPLCEAVRACYPSAHLGGTGWDVRATLADVGVDPAGPLDYRDYPRWRSSIGFTQRGCRLRCSFCVVPEKEGRVRPFQTVADIWRGEPWPREVILLDNDFFGQSEWEARVEELRAGRFAVSFNQGINVRALTPATAAAIASTNYRDDQFRLRRIYTAYDNRDDAGRVERGIGLLLDAGVKGKHLLVYMLVGYWPGETVADLNRRKDLIRSFGAMPYPMPYERTPPLVGYQRWVIGGYDRRIPWAEWERAGYRPERLLRNRPARTLLEEHR